MKVLTPNFMGMTCIIRDRTNLSKLKQMKWIILLCCTIGTLAAQTTRELNDLNWMEFRDFVPGKVQTVLLPIGTMEAHGVANNGADNTAPLAIARAIAPKLNAFVAPVLPYGVTGTLDAFPGSMRIG